MSRLITVLRELDKLIYEETGNKQSIKIILPRAVYLELLNHLYFLGVVQSQNKDFQDNIFINSSIRKFNIEVEGKWK